MYSLDPTPVEVGKELAQRHTSLRKGLKLSQSEMAMRAGVSLGSLKRFESTGRISLESLLKLAHLLGHLKDFENVFHAGEEMNEIEQLFTRQ